MTRQRPSLEFNSHDISRIWQLAIAMYDSEDEEADLRTYFAQALQTYVEFMDDLGDGGIEFEEANGTRFVSERTVGPDGDVVRFRAVSDSN